MEWAYEQIESGPVKRPAAPEICPDREPKIRALIERSSRDRRGAAAIEHQNR